MIYSYPLKPAATLKAYRDNAEFFTYWSKDNGLEMWGATVQARLEQPYIEKSQQLLEECYNTPTMNNILIVDDTPENLSILRQILAEQGYRVRPALSGEIALKAVQANPPDLILLDILMPEMDGYEVCRRLKADENLRHIPIIFISALDELEDKVKAFSEGCVDYITKPFQADEVLARVNTHISLRSTQISLEKKNIDLQNALDEVKQLRGFLPICTSCKSIRDDQGYWESIDIYISNHSDAVCTDSLCPVCEAKAGQKYLKVNLPVETRLEYAKRLEDYMLQQQAFRDDDISVAKVSEELNIPTHHLSITINIEFEQNFYNYVNNHRIRYAEALLKDPNNDKESILMIASLSGFKSKSSFNKAFKALVDMTPSEYRKLHASKLIV